MKPTLSRLALACALLAPVAASAFESIETDTLAIPDPGASGGISGSIDGRSGNTDRKNYTAGGRLHYQAGDTNMFIVTEHSRAKVGAGVIEDNTWVHARYRDEFQRGLAAEAFVDHLNDGFRLLDSRTQLGLGMRFTLDYRAGERALYAGIGLMHEWEDQAGSHDNYWRASTYLSYKRQLNPQSRVVLGLYWQPSLENSSDHLVRLEPAVVVKLAERMDLKVGARYEHDSASPNTVKDDELRYITALAYRF